MTQLLQDAMAICRHFYKPDLFLTMTANPKWPEIIYSLFPGQTAIDCSDIISQVFEQKKKALLKLIDNGFFGTVIFRKYDNYVILSPNNSPKINNSRIALQTTLLLFCTSYKY